jgi:hypothetical protein
MAIVAYGAWAWQVLKGAMFMSSRHLPAFDASIFDFTLRYQRVPGAQYHARPLSLLQQEVLYRCDGSATIADLADATLLKHPEIRDALAFLASHGLVKTLPAEAWLFESITPLPAHPQNVANRVVQRPRAWRWRWLAR